MRARGARGFLARSGGAVLVLCSTAAGCSSDGASLDTVPPVSAAATAAPTSPTTTTTTVASPTTTAVTSTTSTSTSTTVTADGSSTSVPLEAEPSTTAPGSLVPTTVPGGGAVALSEGGPWTRVDSAPGVTTPGLVYELMPKLWVFLPTEEDPDDGSLFVPSPDDIPIIEAYLRAMLVYYRSIVQNPIDLDHPGWVEEFGDDGARYFQVLEQRQQEGQVADLDAGVVMRPYVVGDGPEEGTAIVFDCTLDGGVFRLPDGSLAPGSTPGVVRYGSSALMTYGEGRWITEFVTDQPDACT